MQSVISRAREVAVEAATVAGQLAKQYFEKEKEIMSKGDDGDLVTEVDLLAEREILSRITASFPDHQIRSEETGWSGVEGDWLWLVDPLDGTNNYAIGLPVYGVSITLLYRKHPVLGVIYDSHLGHVYVAEQGKGAFMNGRPLEARPGAGAAKITTGWIQGHQVQKDAKAMRLKHGLDAKCKRVLRLWAPALLWCMLARGDLDGIVLYNSEGDDLYAGILMAKEAGAAVVDFEGNPFEGMNPEPYIVACHPDRLEQMLEMVRTALEGQ
ncbi:Fructose-1, 6-bisphosphatase/inositol-1-monophosphatase [Paenibacillus solanacearum]|uniref:Fructose-1, 6-bisphosphatase/inositol-1-monophosphatase n=1 Tax=Paenibacillus solanacearum TaxID=2048548 RepID=A0A916K0N3_9BACL|nr:inositol monophosphatase family protein [Paenibacillus solanacearum]CAG7617962.1 Fructose-1, 6-bisphosphatase/inositol-1-monophosphatase [Paenibacillus solanacearum]